MNNMVNNMEILSEQL